MDFPIVHSVVCQGGLRFVCVSVWQGYANTEESLGNCVMLMSDMSDAARDITFPSTVKLKAAVRLLFTKHPM